LAPKFLAEALEALPPSYHPDLLVSFGTADDAGVYRLNDRQALVQTVDFFPPIVDDPYDFGRIAAANALSDIYAMGGRPLTALNIVCFPSGSMHSGILAEILKGGIEKIEEAGAVVVGGHSVRDKELKYGIAATGLVHPDKIITNAHAKVGDKLFLTKPLGTGLITTGIKNGMVSAELTSLVSAQMAQLNNKASELMVQYDAHAATDITGYGLLGHALEIARASRVTIRIFSELLPLMPEVLQLAEAGMIPGGTRANQEFVRRYVSIPDTISEHLVDVMYDPQTSGGLLIAIAEEQAERFDEALKQRQIFGQVIGQVERLGDYHLVVE
jgi:selenide,water dikinase